MEPVQLDQWRTGCCPDWTLLRSARGRFGSSWMRGLHKLEDNADFEAAWQQIPDLFPEDLHPNRAGDLNRHMHFAERHDFSDIEEMDIRQ